MIDVHAHILPGMDDGAEDIYDTLEMLQTAADCGVTGIVATPHCNIPERFHNYFSQKYKECFVRVKKAVQEEGIPIQVFPGMEVFATYNLPDLVLERKIISLNHSKYMLIEFAFDEDPDWADRILKLVKRMGRIPVIAHAERYEFVQNQLPILYKWKKKGYHIQINKGSFLGRFGKKAKQVAYFMMDHNLVTVIASDAHSPDRRTTYMTEVYNELRAEYPKEYLDILFRENPRRICQDRRLVYLPTCPFDQFIS